MKHNFSFLPSLRRTTLLALLCLGIMPIWADNVITVAFQKKDVGRELYMQDDNGVVKYNGSSSADASKWRKIPADETFTFLNESYTVYYLQNVKTGKYLCAGADDYDPGNVDWHYRATETGNKSTNDLYKWFIMPKDGNWGILSKGGINTTDKSENDYCYSYHLHSDNQHHTICTNTPIPQVTCGRSGDWNDYSKPAISESLVSNPACTIPNGTTIYVDVTNFTGASTYYLAIVGGRDNASIDLCQEARSYKCSDDQWIPMERVDGSSIYKAKITTNNKNSSLICIWNKDMNNWGNPNEASLAGMTAYDCTSGNNLYTIKEGYVNSKNQSLKVFTGAWSSYTPVDPCPNCGTVPAK